MRESRTIIAHILRKHREQFKLRDQEQTDGENWLTSKETGLLALIVCDIQEALIAQGMVEIAHSFMKEAHPRRERYLKADDAPI
tara:strand:- start:47 stop:298 length:252 start_codon:yes stop_codon:yes gene_type:complete